MLHLFTTYVASLQIEREKQNTQKQTTKLKRNEENLTAKIPAGPEHNE